MTAIEELKTLTGIGDVTAQKLIDNDIGSITKVAIMRKEDLADLLGWSKLKAQETINDAKDKTLTEAVRMVSAEEHDIEITKKVIHYSTGSKAVDDIIGGGVATNEITALRGQFASGKSQMAYSIMASCIEQKRKVAIVEVEPGTFFKDRMTQIAKARGINVDFNKDLFIISAKFITSTQSQFLSYERIKMELDKGVNIGLIVIDSFSPKFREEFQLREQFPKRSQEQMRHIGFLQSLAAEHNLAILLTVQVMGVPDTDKQKSVQMIEASDMAMYGGHVLKHSVQTWLALKSKSKTGQEWQADLFDSSHYPPGTALFRITEAGITDVETKRGKG